MMTTVGKHIATFCRGRLLGRLAVLLLCFFAVLPATAQNRIDQLVDNFATTGSAKFTSVVDRDPKTRRVQKVVKVLEMCGTQAGKFRDAFREESHTGNCSTRQDGDEQTITLTCENKGEIRIYMLRLVGRPVPRAAKTTIIVKKKTK